MGRSGARPGIPVAATGSGLAFRGWGTRTSRWREIQGFRPEPRHGDFDGLGINLPGHATGLGRERKGSFGEDGAGKLSFAHVGKP